MIVAINIAHNIELRFQTTDEETYTEEEIIFQGKLQEVVFHGPYITPEQERIFNLELPRVLAGIPET